MGVAPPTGGVVAASSTTWGAGMNGRGLRPEEPGGTRVPCLTVRTRRMACPGSLPIEALKGESSR